MDPNTGLTEQPLQTSVPVEQKPLETTSGLTEQLPLQINAGLAGESLQKQPGSVAHEATRGTEQRSHPLETEPANSGLSDTAVDAEREGLATAEAQNAPHDDKGTGAKIKDKLHKIIPGKH